jgi:hypothetical protein
MKLLPRLLRAKVPLGVKVQGAYHLAGYLTHACLLMMFLLQPLILYYSQRFHPVSPSHTAAYPFWAVIAAVPSVAPAVYLCFAQWRASERLLPRIPYVLGASVLGAGMMLTTVTAMLRVLYTKKFVFERTPKYGIARSSDSWDGKRYTLGVDWILAAELLLACYGLGSIAYAAALKNWASLIFCSYFEAGLCFVIAVSFVQMSVPVLPRVAASASSGNRDS